MAQNSPPDDREWKEKIGEKIQEGIEQSYKEQMNKLEDLGEKQLVITLLGNGEKVGIIRALTGIDPGELPTEKGFTARTTIYDVRENIFFAETPWPAGKSSHPEKLIEPQSDLVLWFVKGNEKLSPDKKQFFSELFRQGISTLALFAPPLPEEEGNALYEALEETEGVVPLWAEADNEVSMQKLNDEILRLLKARDKELLYLRLAQRKAPVVSRWVLTAAATAFGIAALPLPGSDSLSLAALQTGLCLRIAYVFENTLSHEDLLTLTTTTVTGRVGKRLAALAEEAIRTAGSKLPQSIRGVAVAASRGLVAAAVTYGIGMACYTYYRSGIEGKITNLAEVFNKFAEEYLKG